MVRRNSAFRMATGVLTIAVMLCLVAAISLLNSTPPAVQTEMARQAKPNGPIQVATAGEVSDLLREHPRKPVPEPFESLPLVEPEIRTAELASAPQGHPQQWSPRPAEERPPQGKRLPRHPSAPVSIAPLSRSDSEQLPGPTNHLAIEIAQLKGQINELARSQLENQLTEIRHAEQLLSTHQTQRMIEELQRDVDDLKRQRADVIAAEMPALSHAESELNGSTPRIDRADLPDDEGQPLEPIQVPAAADSEVEVATPPVEATAHIDPTPAPLARVRFAESTTISGRYDVDADQASLEEFLTKLGPVAGWNLVNGPELKGIVTCRWKGIELQPALVQLLRLHGWQIRQEGDFAIIESLAPVPPAIANPSGEVDRISSDSITLQLAPDNVSPDSQTHRPETFTPSAPSVAESPTTRSLLVSDSARSDNPPFSGGIHRPVAPRRGRIVMKDYPELMAQPTHSTSLPGQPSQPLEIEATILQFRLEKDAPHGAFRQALTVAGRGPCPLCGVVHSGAVGQIGHSAEGWVELGDGVSGGVCLLTPTQIVEKLKPLGTISVTSPPRVPVPDRQLAVVGLTELQGFRRHFMQPVPESRKVDLLTGGLQLSLRPTLNEDGLIRLDLQPSLHPQNEHLASLIMTAESCVVIGGLYFENLPPSQSAGLPPLWDGKQREGETRPKDLIEVVVLINVRPQGNSGNSVIEGQVAPLSGPPAPASPSE